MKEKVLHIFNGDSLLHAMQREGLPGMHVAWIEAFCEGPVGYDIASTASLKARESFHFDQYGAESLSTGEAFSSTLRQLLDPEYMAQYDEVTCWFGKDYFCQVNYLALFSNWFQRGMTDLPLTLITTNFYPEVGHVTCLGNLLADQLLSLYPSRELVSPEALQVADVLWQLYTGPDPTRFNSFPLNAGFDSFEWRLFIHNHGQLFPEVARHLNVLEGRILNTLKDKALPYRKLVGSLLQADKYFGLGDSQYVNALERLVPVLVDSVGEGWEREFKLTSLAESLLSGEGSFNRSEIPETHIGGATDANYRWDPVSMAILTHA